MKILYWIIGIIVVGGVATHLYYRQSSTSPNNGMPLGEPVAKKPVIYLYPTKTTNVSVNVKPSVGISYSEPVINHDGWSVVARSDGQLKTADGKTWPYLFWESNPWSIPIPKEGFMVARADIETFFNEKLSYLGLNSTEIGDFKEYWMPIMQEKPYYFVTFVPQAIFDKYAPLEIDPKPDTVIRVFFSHQGLEQPILVQPQILTSVSKRTGFTVVEWGGNGYPE